jgi:uncharacterized protein DUF4157
VDTAPTSVDRVLASSGRPLGPVLRQDMEQRFGHDFSRVRVHTGGAAEQSAREVSANAYTVGHNLVFDANRYSPETHEGRRLIAHELTHVVQQSGADGVRANQSNEKRVLTTIFPRGSSFVQARTHVGRRTSSGGIVQRQESGKPAPISAKTVFPYPENSRLLVNRVLSDEKLVMLAKRVQSKPNFALAVRILRASVEQVATVITASDDVFVAVIPSIDLPAEDNNPAQTIKDVALLFLRRLDGKVFKFQLNVGSNTLYVEQDIEVKKSDGKVELSKPDGDASVSIRSGKQSGELEISADTDNFIFDPLGVGIEILRLNRLPDAQAGSEKDRKIIQQVSQQTAATRREPRQEITLGAGVQSGAKLDPVFAASWRMSFNPIATIGGIVKVPLHVGIEYAPDKSLLAGVSSGLEFATPAKIPVNVRIVGGLAGGAIEGTSLGDGKPQVLPAFGPTIGGGIGIGGKTFRVELDYQHLQNLVRSSPNVDTVILSGGIKF